MLSILIVEDDKTAGDITISALQEFKQVSVAGAVTSGEAAMEFLHNCPVDLVLLDIEMDGLDGFETANRINREFPGVMYAFLTGHTELALNGYDYQPLSFLTKPISISRLEHILEMAEKRKENACKAAQKAAQIGIHTGGQMEILRTDDVAYMENQGRKVQIVCRNHRKIETSESLKKLEAVFEEYGFFRCHQSVVVNLNLIEAIRPDMFKRTFQLQLSGFSENIPLSRDRKKEIQKLLEERGVKVL